jgi:predicted RND superfamily exporter protein
MKRARRLAKWTLVGLGAMTIFLGWRVTQIGFDYDFENFFPVDDPATEYYLKFRKTFETDNDFLIVGVERLQGVADREFLLAVDSLVLDLEKLPYITEVLSPTRLEEPVMLGGSVFQRPLLRFSEGDSDERLAADVQRLTDHPRYSGTLISPNADALAILLSHKQQLSKTGCDTLSAAIRGLTADHSFDGLHIAGRAVAQTYYVDVMQREVVMFVSIALVLITIFLWIAFRSWWGVVIPLTVVLLSGLWLLGLMEITGKAIDVMTIVLPTIIFVVGMSDVVHILSRYYEELRAGNEPFEALKTAFRQVGLATFLTSLTTAIGFLTLLTSSIAPIQDFGLYAAGGVVVAYFLAFTLLPAVLILSPAPPIEKTGSGIFWNEKLDQLHAFLTPRSAHITVVTLLVLGLSAWGISRIEVDNLLLEDLAEDDPFRAEFAFFERAFSGVRPFEMALEIPEGLDPLGPEVMRVCDDVEAYLHSEYGVGAVTGAASILRQVNRWQNGNAESFDKLPANDEQLAGLVRNVQRFDAQGALKRVVNATARLHRISGKVADVGARELERRDEAFRVWYEGKWASTGITPVITGTAALVDLNNATLAEDMVAGLAIAFAVIALISGLMFRSWRMVLISLVPNMLPLLAIAGIMGFADIDLKVSTSIIFTIAFGIAVDDTIHFMSKFRLELGAGRGAAEALKRTFTGTGKAIILTSIMLCGGFITLGLSSFLGTFYIGVLVSLTLLFAVVADLFLLPMLLRRWFRG